MTVMLNESSKEKMSLNLYNDNEILKNVLNLEIEKSIVNKVAQTTMVSEVNCAEQSKNANSANCNAVDKPNKQKCLTRLGQGADEKSGEQGGTIINFDNSSKSPSQDSLSLAGGKKVEDKSESSLAGGKSATTIKKESSKNRQNFLEKIVTNNKLKPVSGKKADTKSESSLASGKSAKKAKRASCRDSQDFFDCFESKREYKSTLLNLSVNLGEIKRWNEADWVKYLLKIKRALPVLADYYSNSIESLAMHSADPTSYYKFGSAENMFESVIDHLEKKTAYVNMYVLITKSIAKLSKVERLVVAYFIDKKDCLKQALSFVSRRSVYRMGDKIIKHLAEIFKADGYSADWLYKTFNAFLIK